MSYESIRFTVDGAPVEARPGQTILQACDEAGIYIPRLCYHPDLRPGGHCRVCTCKVNGRFTGTCYNPAADGLIVENNTPEVNEKRKSLVAMLFVEGNHICPPCEKSGECELQAMGYRLGLGGMREPYLWPRREVDGSHPDIFLDRNKCILCGRCVRASRDVDHKSVFAFENRGIRKLIAVNSERGLGGTNIATDDKAARICPVASIMIKRKAFTVPYGKRRFDLAPIGSEIEARRAAAGRGNI